MLSGMKLGLSKNLIVIKSCMQQQGFAKKLFSFADDSAPVCWPEIRETGRPVLGGFRKPPTNFDDFWKVVGF